MTWLSGATTCDAWCDDVHDSHGYNVWMMVVFVVRAVCLAYACALVFSRGHVALRAAMVVAMAWLAPTAWFFVTAAFTRDTVWSSAWRALTSALFLNDDLIVRAFDDQGRGGTFADQVVCTVHDRVARTAMDAAFVPFFMCKSCFR